MYKLINGFRGTPIGVVIQKDGFVISIPFDPANTDYQEYLKWVAEGNEPLPADE
jgi:hypothetical protein